MAIPNNFPYKIFGNLLPFDQYASVDIAAGANADILTYQIPGDKGKAWLTFFGHGIDNLLIFEDTIWRIRVNGAGLVNYDNISDQLGLFSEPRQIVPTALNIGDTITVNVENNSVGLQKFAARLWGFVDRAHPGGPVELL